MKKLFYILILLFAVALAVHFTSGSSVSRSVAMRESLKNAAQIFVYEGLPHQFFEAELLDAEQKRNDVIEVGGYSFYAPKTLLQLDRMEELKHWLSMEGSFSKFSGEKKCGGFHPDYAVVWEGQKRDYAVLICFGCGEVIFTDGSKKLRYDLNNKTKSGLIELLADYAKKRPNPVAPEN